MKNLLLKRALSLLLVGCMTVSIGIDAFAAEKSSAGTSASVSTVETKTKTAVTPKASGKTYGPWFGDRTDDFNGQGIDQGMVDVTLALIDVASGIIGGEYAQVVVSGITGLAGKEIKCPDDYVYGTIHRRQREVFIAGEFQYFQTEITMKAYMHKDGKNSYLGTSTKIMEGNSPDVTETR